MWKTHRKNDCYHDQLARPAPENAKSVKYSCKVAVSHKHVTSFYSVNKRGDLFPLEESSSHASGSAFIFLLLHDITIIGCPSYRCGNDASYPDVIVPTSFGPKRIRYKGGDCHVVVVVFVALTKIRFRAGNYSNLPVQFVLIGIFEVFIWTIVFISPARACDSEEGYNRGAYKHKKTTIAYILKLKIAHVHSGHAPLLKLVSSSMSMWL